MRDVQQPNALVAFQGMQMAVYSVSGTKGAKAEEVWARLKKHFLR